MVYTEVCAMRNNRNGNICWDLLYKPGDNKDNRAIVLCNINLLFGFLLASKGIMEQILADHWNIQ